MARRNTVISPFQYNPGSSPEVVTYLQGIKGGAEDETYLLVGANNSSGPDPVGLVYQGPLDAVQSNGVSGSGIWTIIAAPEDFDAAGTSVYGPDRLVGDDRVNYVGAFTRDLDDLTPTAEDPAIVGFTYTGSTDGSTTSGWNQVQGVTQSGELATYTFVHSVDGGLAVGNADQADRDGKTGYLSLSSTAFVVDVETGDQTLIRCPGDRNPLVTHTAYGIWDNNDGSYTIAGGSGSVLNSFFDDSDLTIGDGYLLDYALLSGRFSNDSDLAVGDGYLIDYDPLTGRFSNYQAFAYNNGEDGSDLITHFEGIYRDEHGVYYLPATSVSFNGDRDLTMASVATIERNYDGSFEEIAEWSDLDVIKSGTNVESILTTGNSMFANQVVGFANYPVQGAGGTFESLGFVASLD